MLEYHSGYFQADVRRYTTAPFAVDCAPLARLMDDPTFTLKAVERVERQGRELAAVEFESRPADRRSPFPDGDLTTGVTAIVGRAVLDPAGGWVIREAEMIVATSRDAPTVRQNAVSYSEGGDGGLVPRSADFGAWRRLKYRGSFAFNEFAFGPTPPGAFTLAAYGDPGHGRPLRLPSAYYYFGSTGIFLAPMIVFHGLKRRHARRTPVLSKT